MERSHTPLNVWFWAAYLVASQTPGMSAVQFQRQLGLSRYETAFQILHKLRSGMVRPNQDRRWTARPRRLGWRANMVFTTRFPSPGHRVIESRAPSSTTGKTDGRTRSLAVVLDAPIALLPHGRSACFPHFAVARGCRAIMAAWLIGVGCPSAAKWAAGDICSNLCRTLLDGTPHVAVKTNTLSHRPHGNSTALRPRTRRETPFLGAVSSPDGLMESQMAYVPERLDCESPQHATPS